jgi:hypothetical protein
MSSPELDLLDVDRGGRWCQVALLEATSPGRARDGAAELFASGQGAPYVGVVSADIGADAPEVLDALRPGLQEIVCFDSLAEPVVPGQDFAMAALEAGGFGQDFVFTVPVLEEAVDYAVDALLRPEHGGWEGRFVVVIGSSEVLDRAHRHLTAPGR